MQCDIKKTCAFSLLQSNANWIIKSLTLNFTYQQHLMHFIFMKNLLLKFSLTMIVRWVSILPMAIQLVQALLKQSRTSLIVGLLLTNALKTV